MQSDQSPSGLSPDSGPGTKPDPREDFARTSAELKEGVNKELNEARAALHDARDAAYDKAGSLASEARAAASAKAEAAQHSLAGSLRTFGDALRAAGDQLEQKEQGQAAKLVKGAAGGIDSIAGSLKDKPLGDVVNDIRSFARSNPTALVAGSVLAGLALGRFLKSSAPSTTSTGSSGAGAYASSGYGEAGYSQSGYGQGSSAAGGMGSSSPSSSSSSSSSASDTYRGGRDQALADPLLDPEGLEPLSPRTPGVTSAPGAATSSGFGG